MLDSPDECDKSEAMILLISSFSSSLADLS